MCSEYVYPINITTTSFGGQWVNISHVPNYPYRDTHWWSSNASSYRCPHTPDIEAPCNSVTNMPNIWGHVLVGFLQRWYRYLYIHFFDVWPKNFNQQYASNMPFFNLIVAYFTDTHHSAPMCFDARHWDERGHKVITRISLLHNYTHNKA